MAVIRISAVVLMCSLGVACGPSEHAEFDAEGMGHIAPPTKPTPKVLASGQGKPHALVVTSSSVIWTNEGTGEVMSMPLDGGVPVALATGQFEPRGLAVNQTQVFWVNFGGGTVMGVGMSGGAPTLIAQGVFQPTSVAVDDAYVYWNRLAINGGISRVVQGGATPEHIHPNQSGARGISVCEDSLIWANGNDGQIQRGPKEGTFRGFIASGQKNPLATACDTTHAYWISQGSFFSEDGAVGRVILNGGNPQLLAGGQAIPSSLAMDAMHAYWTNRGDGSIRRVLKDGGAVEVIATNQRRPRGIALTSTHLYWINEGEESATGEVVRFEKPAP